MVSVLSCKGQRLFTVYNSATKIQAFHVLVIIFSIYDVFLEMIKAMCIVLLVIKMLFRSIFLVSFLKLERNPALGQRTRGFM